MDSNKKLELLGLINQCIGVAEETESELISSKLLACVDLILSDNNKDKKEPDQSIEVLQLREYAKRINAYQ